MENDEPHQCPPDECLCISSQSDYTTASLCISDDCFLCAHVALSPTEIPPNRTSNHLSSFKGASNFVYEVQHVSGVEWTLTCLSVIKKCGTMTCCACRLRPCHFLALSKHSEEGIVGRALNVIHFHIWTKA